MQSRPQILIATALFTTITILTFTKLRSQPTLGNADSLPALPFGVGFDLTASYGSAAVSFHNGTTTAIATIPGSDEYNNVLQRLSLSSSTHLSPPYDNVGESWGDMLRQYRRRARKAIGLPASTDVGHLASMLSDLRAAVEAAVGPITSAGVTTMHLVALYDEDLHDAFEYLGLQYVTFPIGSVGRNILYETSAAYAGYGHGLCSGSAYRDGPAGCKSEQNNMTDRAIMAIVYTDTVLSVSLSVIRSAYALWEPPYRYLADFDLGYQAPTRRDGPEVYWNAVEDKLQELMVENPNYERPEVVMLMGDRGEDPEFREILEKALGKQMEKMPEIWSKGAVGVAASGAAEMTKRAAFGQESEVDGLMQSNELDL